MPVYIYRCLACGVQYEQQQRYTDPPATRCPVCLRETLRKVYRPAGIVFKGSGFYATDHQRERGR